MNTYVFAAKDGTEIFRGTPLEMTTFVKMHSLIINVDGRMYNPDRVRVKREIFMEDLKKECK